MTRSDLRAVNLRGPRAVLVGIVRQALLDLESGDPAVAGSARAYFLSDKYRHHAEQLGLPPGELPPVVEGSVNVKKRQLSKREVAELVDFLIQARAEVRGVSYLESFESLRQDQPEIMQFWANMKDDGKRLKRTREARRREQAALHREITTYADDNGVDYQTAFQAIVQSTGVLKSG